MTCDERRNGWRRAASVLQKDAAWARLLIAVSGSKIRALLSTQRRLSHEVLERGDSLEPLREAFRHAALSGKAGTMRPSGGAAMRLRLAKSTSAATARPTQASNPS